MDISDLHENIEEDYYISSFFPVELQYHLQPLIEHRIKLILKQTVVFHAGESQNVETCCILDKKLVKLSLMLKSYEHLPVTFESEGSINTKFKGRIKVNLTNYSYQTMKMLAGSTVGYIVLQPYSV
jgi:dUTPase